MSFTATYKVGGQPGMHEIVFQKKNSEHKSKVTIYKCVYIHICIYIVHIYIHTHINMYFAER